MTTVDSIPVWNYLLIGVNTIQSLTSTLHLRDHLIICQLFELITIQRKAGEYSHFTAILCIIHTHYHYICTQIDQLSSLVVTARYLLILVQNKLEAIMLKILPIILFCTS